MNKKVLIKISAGLVFGGLVTTSGWQLVSCQNPNPDDTSLSISKEFSTSTPNVLCKPTEYVTLTVNNTNDEVSWDITNEEEYEGILEFDSTTNANQLVITVSAEYIIAESQKLEITVRAGEKSDSTMIDVGKLIPVPLTTEYFTFEEGHSDTITGFSETVKANPTSLNNYNALDFSNQSNVQLVSNTCTFNKATMEAWKVGYINFGSLTFLNDSSHHTGNQLFKGFNFNTLYCLDFGTSVWASASTSTSAHYTFQNAIFPSLKELKIKQAKFVSEDMVRRTEGGKNEICTALGTFENATMNKLKELDLSGAEFALTGMVAEGNSPTLYIAAETFFEAKLGNLEKLNLSNTKFAADNMGTARDATTADLTFCNANLSNLKELNLTNTIFAAKGMTYQIGDNYTAGFYTAYKTFLGTNLSSLPQLNLSSAVFAVDDMAVEEESSDAIVKVITGFETFKGTNLSELTELELSGTTFAGKNMCKSTNGIVNTASSTFVNAHLDSLDKLDFSTAIFAVEGMSKGGSINTAMSTFEEAHFDSLKELDLSEAILAVSEMFTSDEADEGIVNEPDEPEENTISKILNVANQTFKNFVIGEDFEKLYLPTEYDAELGDWVNTFLKTEGSNPSSYTNTITIYGNLENKSWFNDGWWTGTVTWVDSNSEE